MREGKSSFFNAGNWSKSCWPLGRKIVLKLGDRALLLTVSRNRYAVSNASPIPASDGPIAWQRFEYSQVGNIG